MYTSRGTNSYGQQSYNAQSAYGQNPASTFPGNPAGGAASSSQLTITPRHPSILGSHLESEIGGFRGHPSAAQYGGQYASLYGQTSVSAGQQGATISALSGKGSGPSPMEGRTSYGPAVADSPKYSAKDYVAASSHGYGHKSELLMPDKMAEYASLERRQFAERQGAYVGRDLPVEAGGRYPDSAGYKSEMYDRLDQASILRQDQMLKSQSLQSTPHERQADYLAARSGTFRHPTQELASYGGRLEADPRASVVGNSLYGGQPAPSILGAAPQRNVDDLVYAQTPTNPGYGVSLPPGRDYGMGKGLHGTALDSDFPGSLSSRSGLSRVEDQKDDRYSRELDIRDEERRRERLRDRERERERDHEREREKERERERERKRLLEIREKERERKRATESRRERSPPRSSKDRRGSSLTKDGKSSRRDSPRREALHRIHSPVKEKRRDYVCKVYTSCLVHVERDYLSLDKRYPRLYISPDFSKVVVNWPRENLKLPMHTPVSFEHDLVEVESGADGKEPSTKHSDVASTPEHSSIVWNAKMILMSGLSRSATEDLSSEKLLDDRIPHICNLLKFAVLKKDRSLMAIGGPWDPVDGGDPSVDESSLIRTVLRYSKDMSHLDLQNCQHWNRFFEIHYDRIGKDGLFSHREITVFFVPDLSDCVPSLNAWREQWLAHKKAVADREKQLSLVKEKVRDKKAPLKEGSSPRDVNKAEKKKETVSTGQTADVQKDKGEGLQKASTADKDGEGNKKNTEKKEVNELTDEASTLEKKEAGPSSHAQKSTKPAKKKIVRRVVKQKVTDKTVVSGEDGNNGMNKLEDKAIEVTGTKAGTSGQQDTSPADVTAVKTFTRKKVAKKLSDADADVKVVDKESDLKNDKQSVSTEEPVVKSDATLVAVVKDGPVKRVVKRKIIKRVPKKKATGAVVNSETSDNKAPVIDADNAGDAQVNKEQATEGEKLLISASTTQAGVESSQKVDDAVLSSKTVKSVDKIKGKEEEGLDGKRVSEDVTVKDIHADGKEKSDGKVKVKDGKERKEKDSKDDLKSKSSKDVDRKKSDEPPRHPGFILQTKSGKAAKLRSLSLSLDSLLDYSDKDIEEETFELSVFAESFYEMLQYQMGSRVLSFLQELRIKFIAKRNSRKRQREQNADSKIKEKTATKRSKTEDTSAGEKSSKSQMNETQSGHEKLITKEDNTVDKGVKSDKTDDTEKMTAKDDEEMIEEEDPEEEDPEEEEEEEEDDDNEEEEMQDKSPQKDSIENQKEGDEQDAKKQTTEDNANHGEKKASGDVEVNKQKEVKDEVLKKASADKVPVDSELLQAFRFFDRNRVGYIRVEDLRMIIHNLGKFLSHRDVKELVQSALLESNTGRDDRVLYEKLVRMSLNVD